MTGENYFCDCRVVGTEIQFSPNHNAIQMLPLVRQPGDFLSDYGNTRKTHVTRHGTGELYPHNWEINRIQQIQNLVDIL